MYSSLPPGVVTRQAREKPAIAAAEDQRAACVRDVRQIPEPAALQGAAETQVFKPSVAAGDRIAVQIRITSDPHAGNRQNENRA
jgi:hypothetical protein